MITVPELAAEALGSFLAEHMSRRFSSTHAGLTELIPSLARLSLEYSKVSLFDSPEAERSWALRSIRVMPSRFGAGSIVCRPAGMRTSLPDCTGQGLPSTSAPSFGQFS